MQTRDKEIVIYYLSNLLRNVTSDELEKKLCAWFENNSKELIGYDIEDQWERRSRYYSHRNLENEEALLPQSTETIKNVFLQGQVGRLHKRRKTDAIMSVFQLSAKYEPFIELLVNTSNIPILESLLEQNSMRDEEVMIEALIGMLHISRSDYKKLFSLDSELVQKGLFRMDNRGMFNCNSKFRQIMVTYCETPNAIKQTVLGKKSTAKLTAKNYSYMTSEYEWVRDLVANALKKKQSGINILIYGIPGTGKTEMVKTICRDIGVSLYSVSDNSNVETGSSERRNQLAMAQTLLQNNFQTALMIDEAEDIFEISDIKPPRFASDKSSKLFLNRLLENNSIPVIWITNIINGIDPASLWRFSHILRMDPPDEKGQSLIWKSAARRYKFPLPKNSIDDYVRKYDLPPAIIDTAVRTASVMDNQNGIEKTVRSLLSVFPRQTRNSVKTDTTKFIPELFNCEIDLEEITQQIMASKIRNFSFCLYGVPGSGKSAFARFLAGKLGMGVLQKRASDLMGPFVGMTEHNIAGAFMEAKSKKKILVFDEADSFLRDRRKTFQSWETSSVNEMLTQMKSHDLPFFCTTNLMENLDQASLRRFTFKLKYHYLSLKQVRIAFQYFFNEKLPESAKDLEFLTPGDFAVVAQKNAISKITDAEKLVDLLRIEHETKENGAISKGRLGFNI